jgi:hypothetical protein
MPLILFRQHSRIGLDWPFDAEVRVVPEDACIVTGTVICSYFVEDFSFIFKCAKTMQESGVEPTTAPLPPHQV